MCGILLSIGTNGSNELNGLLEAIARRGPDHQMNMEVEPTVTIHSSVLHLRGSHGTQQQPMQDKNGNILAFNGEIFGGITVDHSQNDAKCLSDHLSLCRTESDILAVFGRIQGEFALVFYHSESRCLYFGRDYLGRRSLLLHASKKGHILISSVGLSLQTADCQDPAWNEVSTQGLFKIDLSKTKTIECIPWSSTDTFVSQSLEINSTIPSQLDLTTPTTFDSLPEIQPDSLMHSYMHQFESVLHQSVNRRVESIPMNQSGDSDARLAVLFSGGLDCMAIAALCHRVVPHEEPIDLLNVSFENPRIMKHAKPPIEQIYDVPDRLTGRKGWKELSELYPEREWRFVEIDVAYQEVVEMRQRITDLVAPLDTVMDLSISMAFWFAARGRGVCKSHKDNLYKQYESKAKVLLSGLGADEQLGGYSRHRVQFQKTSWQGLVTEIQRDVNRISTRNLGRDDRIISDHGKEVRFPFLDEDVIQFLCRVPINLKVDPRFSKGIGDKLLLRLVANKILGLDRASTEPKRAIQFGARTAKMEHGQQKGQDKLLYEE